MKPGQSDRGPLADGIYRIWSCPLFMNLNINERYMAVRKQLLCYGCLGRSHAIEDCKVEACGINGYSKKHYQLL